MPLQRSPSEAGSSQPSRTELDEAYRYLRRIEHRLQMIADEQTHEVPADPAAARKLRPVLRAMRSETEFSSRTDAALETVQKHYAGLFEDAPS